MHASYAQPSLSSRMTTSRSLNRQFYLWDTGFRRIFVMKHFRMLDSLCLYDSLLNASISGTVGSLSTVTGIGNTTTTLMKVYNSGSSLEANHAYSGFTLSTYPGGNAWGGLAMESGTPRLRLYSSAAGYSTYIQGTGLTANRGVLMPDEGDGVGLDSKIMLHTSADAFTCTDGTTYTAEYDKDNVHLSDNATHGLDITSQGWSVADSGATDFSVLSGSHENLNYTYYNSVGSVLHSASLIFSRPSFTGTTSQSVYFTSHTADTLATLKDGWNLGAQRWDGNYTQHVAKKSIYFDSTFSYKIQDTSANQLLNLNDTSLYTTSMIYASSRSDKTARMRTPNGMSEMFVIGNATSNLARLKGGDNTINLSQSSAVCNINLVCGSGGNVTLVLDSISQGIKIRPKIVEYNSVSTVGYGVPAIYGTGRATAQTAANASVATYTLGAADGSFEVSANVNVTVSSGENFTVTCAYTDETNTARTLTLPFIKIAGTFAASITSATGAAPYHGQTLAIRCKAGTTITIATTGTFTGCTYNVEGTIKQIN